MNNEFVPRLERRAIDERIIALEIGHTKDIEVIKVELNLRFSALDKALTLQSAELSRRLAELNGAAGRLKEMQAIYLPREKFDDFEKSIAIDMIELSKLKGQLKGSIVFIASAVSILTTLAMVFLQYTMQK